MAELTTEQSAHTIQLLRRRARRRARARLPGPPFCVWQTVRQFNPACPDNQSFPLDLRMTRLLVVFPYRMPAGSVALNLGQL